MLDTNILSQVRDLFQGLQSNYTLAAVIGSDNDKAVEMREFLNDFASTSDRLMVTFVEDESHQLAFSLLKDGQETGIRFRGIPNGHEFTSLLLAVLNADGQGKNLPDEVISRRIAAIQGEIKFETYVSLTCTNCPDVVQALNVMALLNPSISNEMIDGALFQDEVSRRNIQGVPSVFVNGEPFHTGRGDLGELLQKLEDRMGSSETAIGEPIERTYDVVVLGGGPAGASAAIYSARKGLRVGIIAERIGGQVKDTVGIENLISVPQTTGAQLAADLKEHIGRYEIDVFENRKIDRVALQGTQKRVFVRGGEEFVSPAVIIATGASWRRLNVEEETRYIGHGVHFCPHCDGPFYRNKNVAVIGGGNSGIEAAITVLEFADKLGADTVLQEKAHSLGNVDIFVSSQTTAVLGDDEKVTAIRVKDRNTDTEREIKLDGVFVQIGLSPNSDLFRDQLELTARREVKIDETNRTSLPGVYAAGDVSSVPYKQIVIAMGEGAKAALSAFDDRIRGLIAQ